ncbi:hypothetical protein BH24GEM2_BH24GEM2_02230 [soil metagenome]
MRGIILNPARRCPSCGEETMRGEMPFLLAPVGMVLGAACSYRWCRRCRRMWLALHRARARPHRRDTARVARFEPKPAVPAPAATPSSNTPPRLLRLSANVLPGLTGGWVAVTGSLTWRLGLIEDPRGELSGGGVLEGGGQSFPLAIRGQSAGDKVTLQVEAAGSRMEFRATLTGTDCMEARLYMGDTPRPLTLVRVKEQGAAEPLPAQRSQAA